MSPFDIVNSIYEKKPLEEGFEKDYNPWVINKALSFNMDTLFFANELNRRYQGNLTPKQQYDFYFNAIPKKKRYGKWIKKDKEDEFFEVVQEYYNLSNDKTLEIINTLSKEDLEQIKLLVYKGGKNGK